MKLYRNLNINDNFEDTNLLEILILKKWENINEKKNMKNFESIY